MRVEPRLAALACAAVWIWSCNALWGVDDLSFDGATTATAGGGGATSSTSTGAGGQITTSSGGTGGAGGQAMVCLKACNDLFDCGIENGNCPGFAEDLRVLFVEGCDGSSGCLGQCGAMPALISLVNTDDCAGTVAALYNVSADFAVSCSNGIAGCGGAGSGGAGP